jgi:hypothetical protein
MKKIYLVGAQGTGKTTILDELRKAKLNCDFISEVTRKFNSEYGISINKESTNTTQLLIFNKYLELFLLKNNFISDRSLIDVLAYTSYFVHLNENSNKIEKVDKWLLRELDIIFREIKNKIEGTYFYFPIEFAVKKDDFRSEDEEYRKQIDNLILGCLAHYRIPYIEVRGSIEERTQIILNNI